MDGKLEQCQNCDGVIGRLEQSYLWQGHRVCRECHRRLSIEPPGNSEPMEESSDVAQSPPTVNQQPPALSEVEGRAAVPPRELLEHEEIIWEESPSQVTNLRAFALHALAVAVILVAVYGAKALNMGDAVVFIVACLLAIPLFFAGKKWLEVRCKQYTLTTERLRTTTGIFSRRVDELELYRVKDTTYVQPFFLRMLKLGHIVLVTSDRTTPTVLIEAVPNARERREQIRQCVEMRRDKKRVREVDFE